MGKLLASYGAVALPASNKMDKLKPDSTGYYKMVLGAFDVFNNKGEFYPLVPTVKALFQPGGMVRRRLDNRLFGGELGHPDMTGFKDRKSALNRVSYIDPTRKCVHIKQIDLVEHKDENGKNIVLSVGMIKPSGPYGASHKEQLDNPEENVAYSVRSFTKAARGPGGTKSKIIIDIPAYDNVTEGGISHATQYMVTSLEHFEEINFNEKDIEDALDLSTVPGFEHDITSLRMVKTFMGWQKIEIFNTGVLNWK